MSGGFQTCHSPNVFWAAYGAGFRAYTPKIQCKQATYFYILLFTHLLIYTFLISEVKWVWEVGWILRRCLGIYHCSCRRLCAITTLVLPFTSIHCCSCRCWKNGLSFWGRPYRVLNGGGSVDFISALSPILLNFRSNIGIAIVARQLVTHGPVLEVLGIPHRLLNPKPNITSFFEKAPNYYYLFNN